ncbi:2-oxoacid:acceptor oxidoreductase subunit alpha [Patescibacteria group bacterium]|nr:2-oxoacid:acceptor oxidoreductase subunit alpha [Patescibacteria group bacterium]
MSKQEVLTIKIAGQAGQGIKSSGILLAKFAKRSGYNVFNYIEYPSIIRGGHNVMQINISLDEVTGPSYKIDFLIALNQDSIDFHLDEYKENSSVLYDSETNLDLSKLPENVSKYPLPLLDLARECGGSELHINTVALGALIGLKSGDIEVLKVLLKEEFEDKGENVIKLNQDAAEKGYSFVLDKYKDDLTDKLKHVQSLNETKDRILINGNEAVALGAIRAGLQFAAIYPMSPISNILHVLAKYQEEYGYVYKQPEDEISAINMSIGASFAGARAMTATSGGGFCLMGEGYGLAGIAEVPLVIVEGMRGGPGTGLPTWSEQGDLRMVLHMHQGDFPRIVLAAGDPQEAYYLTLAAFNLAERYQTTVVLLIDKNICENDQSYPIFDSKEYVVDRGKFSVDKIEDYKRYELSADGISIRSIPGVGNFFIANSDEHNEYGYSSEEIDNRNSQMNKRMKKLETCASTDMPPQTLYGSKDADVTIISWGSNKGSILQAIKEHENVNYLHITWMNPFPTGQIKKVLEESKHVLGVEASFSAQFLGLVKEKTGIEVKDKLLKYDGRPFYTHEIQQKIDSILGGKK